MAWTDLTFAFGSVLTSTQMTQLDDNFDALAAGLSGAPSIQTAAIANDAITDDELASPAAAATATVCRVEVNERAITTTSYDNVNSLIKVPGETYGLTALVSGSVRISLEHKASSAIAGDESYVRVVKNGAQQVEWTKLGTSYTARSYDLTVTAGDNVQIQHRAANAARPTYIRLILITADAQVLAVA